jgi:uncharacterized membrane protein YeaQ/YmgE (transglycosylase-associated protein family)
MSLLIILIIGALAGLLSGALLRRVGAITRLFDAGLGVAGAFVAVAMGTQALIEGLTQVDGLVAALAAAGLVLAAHVSSALIRPVHAKYFQR